MPRYAAILLRIITVAAWGLTGLDLTPLIHLSPAADLFLMGVGCMGWCDWIVRRMARPVDEVFQAGYMLGKGDGLREAASPQVTPIAARQRLRAVSD